jgi:hypothetical protein
MNEPDPKNRKALAALPDRKPYAVGHGKTKRILEIISIALVMRASPNCVQRRIAQLNLKRPDYLLRTKEMRCVEQESASKELRPTFACNYADTEPKSIPQKFEPQISSE